MLSLMSHVGMNVAIALWEILVDVNEFRNIFCKYFRIKKGSRETSQKEGYDPCKDFSYFPQ